MDAKTASPRRGTSGRPAAVAAVAVLAVLALVLAFVLARWLAADSGRPYTGIAPTTTLSAGPAPVPAGTPDEEVVRDIGAAKSLG